MNSERKRKRGKLRFSGRVALVTGGARGAGRTAALAFARGGARVVISGRCCESGEAVAREICAGGGEAMFVPADLSCPEAAQALICATLRAYGRLDAAFNQIGGEPMAICLASDREEAIWGRAIDTDLRSAWHALKHQIPAMPHGGGIVFAVPTPAVGETPEAMIAAAGSAAIIGLMCSAAVTCADQGIHINAVQVGAAEALVRRPEEKALFGARRLSARGACRCGGKAKGAAEAAVWLCSEDASYINGQVLGLDIGFPVL